jgi:uncharacterized protein YihD (DUF1040 family)
MRNHKRIDRMTEKLNKLWKCNPDWRLCQLIFNIARNTDTMYSLDVFYVEDDIMEITMNKLLEVSKKQ